MLPASGHEEHHPDLVEAINRMEMVERCSTASGEELGGIKALIFDLDGVLIDSERVLLGHWQAIFAEHGCSFTDEEWLASVGSHRSASPYLELCERALTPPPGRHAVESRLRELACDDIRRLGPLPGVIEWIVEAERMDLQIAVASSSSSWWVEGRLGDIGLLDRIPVRSCRSSKLRAKPAPDLYLDSCQRLGVDPAFAVAVEDSHFGMQAAIAAGLRCIAVPSTVTASLDFQVADLVLRSLRDLTLVEAIEQLSSAKFKREGLLGR